MPQIISKQYRIFKNRYEAGTLLAEALAYVKKTVVDIIVVGIPRGGLIVADAIANELHLPLDLILISKLSAPYQPELAIGAIDENGNYYINRSLCALLQIPASYLTEEKKKKLAQLKEKKTQYRAIKPRLSLTGKTVIVVDDGIATGASLKAALILIKKDQPQQLLAAIPVGPLSAIQDLEGAADKIICWQAPPTFIAVGEFYEDFHQTTDAEVLTILKKHRTVLHAKT
jgi:predicted phosphoribosyltransferase